MKPKGRIAPRNAGPRPVCSGAEFVCGANFADHENKLIAAARAELWRTFRAYRRGYPIRKTS
jgi:hypothetical protein